ncbi:MAG TPA: tripartite tricarboxylate transporter substrate-binding protein [Usitatibacter sp.]|nr:tripartite tricarboxylate transporter substrate-binding protein [Usitatibacter sp.]
MKRWILALAALAMATAAAAADWPTRTVRMIVPFPAGGATDVVARLLSQKLGEAWGQTVVVENRSGAGGNIGGEAAAHSPADGYTLFMTSAPSSRRTRSCTGRSPTIRPGISWRSPTWPRARR